MPTRQERIAEAYRNIKKITGLEFDEKDVKQVERAFGKIYINGHNYCIKKDMRPLSSVESGDVLELESALLRAQNPDNESFISIMNPDDPYAVPRMIPYRDPESDSQWILNDAAKAYEKNFRKTHRENIRRLREDIAADKAVNKTLLDPEPYFGKDLLTKGGGFKNKGNYISELTNRTTNAVFLCNAVLLGRGYTVEELCSNDPEVLDAKKSVGQELIDLMYGTGSNQEKNEKMQALLDEVIEGFGRQRMKSVDYSDDSTFDNVRYNQALAAMVTNAEQVINKARSDGYITNSRLDEQEKQLVRIKNFTDGIMLLDSRRIKEIEKEFDMPDTMINQLLMDRMGTSYNLYRTAEWNKVEKEEIEQNLGYTIQNAVDPDVGDLGEPSEEYQNAYDQFLENGDPEPFKALLNSYVDKNKTVIQQAEEEIGLAARGKKILPEGEDYWFTGIPDMTRADYMQGLKEALKANSSSQTDRVATMQNLFLAYGLYEAEQTGQNRSLQDFFTDTELQKETGKKAYEFFTTHPIPGATPEETAANVKVFGQVIAALNRKLLDTEIPRCNFEDRKEAVSGKKYLYNLKSLMTDSHQLNGLVPKDMWQVFEAEQGGKEKYEETKNQISIAEDLVQAEHSLYDAGQMGKKSFNAMFYRSDALQKSIQGVYLLSTVGRDWPGRKIGELPKDTPTAEKVSVIEEQAQSLMRDSLVKKSKTLKGKKQLIEYVTSFGKKDPAHAAREIVAAVARVKGEVSKETEQHDWFAEYKPEEWKQRLEKFYADVDSHDPALLHSSAEYKAVKAGLKEAAKAVKDKDKFNQLMDKVFHNAGDYIQKKLNTKIGEHYGKERLEVITNVRDLLAAGKEKPLSSEKIGELFGTGETPEQRMESAIIRIGKYLGDVEKDVEEKDYQKAYKSLALLERVLTEGGKNRETLNALREELNVGPGIAGYDDRKKLLETARDRIARAAVRRLGENSRMAGWYHVMDAYKQVVKKDPNPEIQALADKNAVRNVDLLGSLTQTAMSARLRVLDVNTDHSLTKNELGALIATDLFEQLMHKQARQNKKDYVKMIDGFLKEQKSVENIAGFFADSENVKKLSGQNENGNLERYVLDSKVRQVILNEREHQFIMDRLQKFSDEFGSANPALQQVKQNEAQRNKAQKDPMNF